MEENNIIHSKTLSNSSTFALHFGNSMDFDYNFGGLDFIKYIEMPSPTSLTANLDTTQQEFASLNANNSSSTSSAPHFKQDSFDMEALLQSIQEEPTTNIEVDISTVEGVKEYMEAEEAAYRTFLSNHIASFFSDFIDQCKTILDSKKVKRTISISKAFEDDLEAITNREDSKKSRKNLSAANKVILMKWLENHIDNPYPSEEEKQVLKASTGLSNKQLSSWFVNARSRYLPKLKEQSMDHQNQATSCSNDTVDREIERQVLQYVPQQRGKREFKMQLKIKLGRNPFEKSL